MDDIKGRTYYQISRDRVSDKLRVIESQKNIIVEVRDKISDITDSVKTYAVCSGISFLATMSIMMSKDVFLALAVSCMLCGIIGGLLFGAVKLAGHVVGDNILASIQSKLFDQKSSLQKAFYTANQKLIEFDKNTDCDTISSPSYTSDSSSTASFIKKLFGKNHR
jgi:hypothetical protein